MNLFPIRIVVPGFGARAVAGAGIFLLTLLVLAIICWRPALANNDLFKMLAQAIVVQGLIGLCMAHWFTAQHRPHGRSDTPDQPDAEG